MQLPNVTLFLQIIHFFIVCMILRRLVFAPALQIIVTQDAHEKNLQKNIVTWQTEYEAIVKHAQEKWLSIKAVLLQLIPSLKKQYPVTDHQNIVLTKHQLSEQQRASMSQLVQDSVSEIP